MVNTPSDTPLGILITMAFVAYLTIVIPTTFLTYRIDRPFKPHTLDRWIFQPRGRSQAELKDEECLDRWGFKDTKFVAQYVDGRPAAQITSQRYKAIRPLPLLAAMGAHPNLGKGGGRGEGGVWWGVGCWGGVGVVKRHEAQRWRQRLGTPAPKLLTWAPFNSNERLSIRTFPCKIEAETSHARSRSYCPSAHESQDLNRCDSVFDRIAQKETTIFWQHKSTRSQRDRAYLKGQGT